MQKPTIFTREATGLVKAISPLDSLGVGLAALGISSPYLFFVGWGSTPYDNPFLALLVGGIMCLVGMTAWTLVAITFPRAGGDYVFNTRVVHPVAGIMVDMTRVVGIPLFFPFNTVATLLILSDMFTLEGIITKNPSLSAAGNFLLVPNVEFVIITIAVILTTFFLIGQMKGYLRWQTITNLGGMVVILIVAVVVLSTSNSAYQTDFTKFFGVDYNSVIPLASKAGLSTPIIWKSFPSLVGASTVLFYVWLEWPTALSGEMRNPPKSIFISLIGTIMVSLALFAIAGTALFTFGTTFETSAAYLLSIGHPAFPTQGFIIDLAAPMMANPILIAILFIVFAAGSFFGGAIALLVTSRKIFAWSFDRLIPSKFSEVSPRFKVPVYSAILIGVIAEIFTVVFVYGPGIYAVASGFGALNAAVMITMGCISAAVLPFRKSLFARAPAIVQKRIGPIPILSILGFVSLGLILWIAIGGQILPAIASLNVTSVEVSGGLLLAGLVLYYCAKYYRRRKNTLDLSMVYEEIPPE
jgi:amino acid transporter